MVEYFPETEKTLDSKKYELGREKDKAHTMRNCMIAGSGVFSILTGIGIYQIYPEFPIIPSEMTLGTLALTVICGLAAYGAHRYKKELTKDIGELEKKIEAGEE